MCVPVYVAMYGSVFRWVYVCLCEKLCNLIVSFDNLLCMRVCSYANECMKGCELCVCVFVCMWELIIVKPTSHQFCLHYNSMYMNFGILI